MDQEGVRTELARAMVVVLALTIAGGFMAGVLTGNWASVKDLLQVLLTAETPLLVPVFAFYFGKRR